MKTSGELGYVARSILFGTGLLVAFFVLLEGFHSAVRESGGVVLADHTLRFCPNWLLGLLTGAFFVGLLWWAWPKRA